MPAHTGLTILDCQKKKRRQSKPQNWRAVWISEWFKPWLNVNFESSTVERHKAKTGRTDALCGFCCCVASSKPSNCSFALLLQACFLGSLALPRTLLVQQLQWLQQDRRFRLFTSLFSCCLKTDSVASFLRETVEMFSQFRSRWKDGLVTFLYSNFCGLGSSLLCSYWPFIKVM